MKPYGFISAGAAGGDATNVPGSTSNQTGDISGVDLEGFTIENTHATLVRYVKFYNKASPASTDTPFWRFALAPAGGGVSKSFKKAAHFANLSFRITAGAADNDNTAVAASDVFVNLEIF